MSEDIPDPRVPAKMLQGPKTIQGGSYTIAMEGRRRFLAMLPKYMREISEEFARTELLCAEMNLDKTQIEHAKNIARETGRSLYGLLREWQRMRA